MTKTSAQTELRRRLSIALGMPAVLIVVVGVILGAQLLRMQADTASVEHSDNVISELNQAQREIVDQETAIRGFFITQEQSFLAPYDISHPEVPLDLVHKLVSDNPPQLRRAEELRRRYRQWHDAMANVAALGSKDAFTLEGMRSRRAQMDQIRGLMQQMLDMEFTLRKVRMSKAAESSSTARFAFVVLLAGTAAAIAFVSRKQLLSITETYGGALEQEREAREAVEIEAWVRSEQAQLSNSVQGENSVESTCKSVIEGLARSANASVGAIFTRTDEGWARTAGYALDGAASGPDRFALGEGLIGAAGEKDDVVRISTPSEDSPRVRSGLADRLPAELLIAPARSEGRAIAIVELGFVQPPAPRMVDLLRRSGETIAIAVRSAEYKQRLRDLLEESQRLAETLQAQQEELRVANEELHERSNALQEAQQRLEEQQHELETTNARLEEQRNDLIDTQGEVGRKAAEVERASHYKSEFLANMSHELRTPLNSTLILAKLLADNSPGTLTAEQVKFAQTIYASGNDLLTLINDVLDLSKIEAGKIDVHVGPLSMGRTCETLSRIFEPMARDKKIAFEAVVTPGTPTTIETDSQRVEQILKNLLSNAVKFTETGKVALTVQADGDRVSFVVSDSGIGIAPNEHGNIFEAFRQVDGAVSRKHGGTGLGLSISRDLARLLGGTLEVESTPGAGSVFTFTLPRAYRAPVGSADNGQVQVHETHASLERERPRNPRRADTPLPPVHVADDRDALDPGRRIVLVVEDDPRFAEILVTLAHEVGFQTIVAGTAAEGIALARKHRPNAVVLDMNLPDHSGLSVLDRLKRDPITRHIPVHVMSVADYAQEALSMGAIGYLIKPVKRDNLLLAFKKLEERASTRVRRLLIVEDDDVQRESLTKLLATGEIEVQSVGNVADALEALRATSFDCVVMDLTLPDVSGFELLERMAVDEAYAFPPVIVYTGRSLSTEEEHRLRRYSSSIIVKGARSPERLVDEVALFLHQVEADLPADRQRMLRQARAREALFEDRTILVVEDDVRNIFALTSVLEPKGAKIHVARNGIEALASLKAHPEIDLVLMDIMMPEMDGLTCTQEIRKEAKWAKLPILALTAKAMKDDQERCLRAGVNDYISKPLDVEMLLSLLRIWMPK